MKEMILETKDYSKFQLLEFNRDVERTKFLAKSMQEHGWISAYPMHVVRNGKGRYKIKAGHHRFTVAQSLGIPVKYVICDDDATIYQLEVATENWKMKHYLTAYVREGTPEYIHIEKYHARTGIPLFQCISMLAGESAGSHNKLLAFKKGYYKLGDTTHAEIVADMIKFLTKIKVSWSINSRFVCALSKVTWVKEFHPSVFKNKCKTFSFLLEKQRSVEDYIDLIEAIYNRQNKLKIPLSFMATMAAKERNAVKTS